MGNGIKSAHYMRIGQERPFYFVNKEVVLLLNGFKLFDFKGLSRYNRGSKNLGEERENYARTDA